MTPALSPPTKNDRVPVRDSCVQVPRKWLFMTETRIILLPGRVSLRFRCSVAAVALMTAAHAWSSRLAASGGFAERAEPTAGHSLHDA